MGDKWKRGVSRKAGWRARGRRQHGSVQANRENVFKARHPGDYTKVKNSKTWRKPAVLFLMTKL